MTHEEWMAKEKLSHDNDVKFMLEELAMMDDAMMECYALGENDEDHP